VSGSVMADILIPVAGLVALVVLIGAVLLAARNPAGKDTGQRPRWAVSGGTFRGDPRQQVPHRDDVPPETLAREGRSTGGDQSAD